MLRPLAIASLAPLLFACGKPAKAHAPIARPAAPSLAAGVQTCGAYNEIKDGQRCRFYSTQTHAFVDPPDALTERAYQYQAWLDRYHSPEGQSVERNLNVQMQPGDPESRWGDDHNLSHYDDYGDSSLWTATAGMDAAFRYAVTGVPEDRARLERYVRASLSQFEATGFDGYLARFHFAGVPDGTRILNGLAMEHFSANSNSDAHDIPASALPGFPAYYTAGVTVDDKLVPAVPKWVGNPSIDQYSGFTSFYPLAFALLDDADLKTRMTRQYTCFLKRLKIFKVTNLSKNVDLQSALAKYLNAGYVKQDADEPDLSKTDQVWGFYLPQVNNASLATYPKECPATLATDAVDDADNIDLGTNGGESKLLSLVLRQRGNTTDANAIDFAYFTSVRGGDGMFLQTYALAAYYMTQDPAYLKWRDEVLIAKGNAQQIARTVGAFSLPRECTSYYRDPNLFTSAYIGLQLEGDDAAKAERIHIWRDKLHAKWMGALDNTLFEELYAGVMGTKVEDRLLSDLAQYGGSPGHRADPRRNYDIDNQANPPPGIVVGPPSASDAKVCSTGIDMLGFHIDGPGIDGGSVYSDKPLPLQNRLIGGFAWEHGPYYAARHYGGGQGTQQYPGVDLSEAYWVARYHKQLPDPHVVLAWGPAN